MTTQDTELEDISTISTKKLGMKFAQMIGHPTAVSLCLSSDNISVCLPEITAVLITTCVQSSAGFTDVCMFYLSWTYSALGSVYHTFSITLTITSFTSLEEWTQISAIGMHWNGEL